LFTINKTMSDTKCRDILVFVNDSTFAAYPKNNYMYMKKRGYASPV